MSLVFIALPALLRQCIYKPVMHDPAIVILRGPAGHRAGHGAGRAILDQR